MKLSTIIENKAYYDSMANHVIELILRTDSAANRGALVGARDLFLTARKAMPGITKTVFDHMMINAMKSGKVVGHMHDYVSSLSDEERNEMVNNPNVEHYGHSGVEYKGAYYIGFGIRQNR